MIVIVNYGMGNVGSVFNMLRKIGSEAKISSLASDIESADKIILPGVGAFDAGMTKLQEIGLIEALNQHVLVKKKPILGICLGMQLMTKKSEEGQCPGLGWIEADTVKFKFGPEQLELKTPHMGWNSVETHESQGLFKDCDKTCRYYFVHSYHLVCRNKEDVLGTTEYGYQFVSAIHRNNIYGVQFHPEKSLRYGMDLLKKYHELS